MHQVDNHRNTEYRARIQGDFPSFLVLQISFLFKIEFDPKGEIIRSQISCGKTPVTPWTRTRVQPLGPFHTWARMDASSCMAL
jgi:hypothetical protein